MDCKTLWKTYFSLFLLFLILRHWRTKLLAKHRENPIFPWSMDTKLLTPIITPHWSSPSPPFSMLIYARPKCGIGLKIGGINIEWGGKGDILRQYFLFWGENGTFANLFCPPVSEVPRPGMVTLACLIYSILLQVRVLEERNFSQKFGRISMWWRHSMTS